jgi:transcription initiation factor IIE alpha subunit
MGALITIDVLAKAIKNSIDRFGMEDEYAIAMSEHVLHFFGFSDRIIDNVLEPEDRDLFYQLEDSNLLTTEREETTLYDGREWRIHYWVMNVPKVNEVARSEVEELVVMEEEDDIYTSLPDEIWATRTKPAA